MNNPNPFIPQGSLLEQKNRKRTRFQVAVFAIFAVNILVITPMLIQGCSHAQDATNTTTPGDTGTAAPVDTTTNVVAPPPPLATNPAVAQQPPPPPVPSVPAATGATEYVIAKGDTLDAIHKKFSVSVKAITDANPGIVPTKLQLGQKIQIPAPTAPTTPAGTSATVAADGSEVYVVKAGDNLSTIAKAHHTGVKAIETLNNLKTTKINVGDKLKMPPPKAAAPTPPTADTPVAPVTAPSAPAAPAVPKQ